MDEARNNLLFRTKLYFGKRFGNSIEKKFMRKLPVFVLLMTIAFVAKSQDWHYENGGTISDLVGTVRMGENIPIIVSVADPGKVYCGYALREELRVNGLKIKVSGILGKIPPNVRMMCSPLKITEASIIDSSSKKIVKSQDWGYEIDYMVTNEKGTVKFLENQEIVVIVPDKNPTGRYISNQLPEEYRKDGLKVTYSGDVGKIPPNFRMLGTPLRLKCICVSSKEQKKFKLKKRKYVFS